MRKKDVFDELADDIVFNCVSFRDALERSDDAALSHALAERLRSLPPDRRSAILGGVG